MFVLLQVSFMSNFSTVLLLSSVLLICASTEPLAKQVETHPKEIFVGTFGAGQSYAQDVYLIPNSIRVRGDLRRYQTRQVFQQEQDTGLGFKQKQAIVYSAVNCREGSKGIQRAISFNAEGRQVDDSIYTLELKVPPPGSTNEREVDMVCDYQSR